jgi:uncharacterized protein YndB with AHSA1/START domain
VWAALTDRDTVAAWTEDGDAEVDPSPGGRFDLFGGLFTGTFQRLDEPFELQFTLHRGDWPDEWPDPTVVWKLGESGDNTVVEVEEIGLINDEQRSRAEASWEEDWFAPLREWLEGGRSG